VEDTPLYDTFQPAAGSTMQGGVGANSQLFTNVGFNAGKNYAQTNMQEPQKLPAPEAFSIFGIRLGWNENILPTDLFNFLATWAYEFWLGQKWYQRANPRHFSSGWGITGSSTQSGVSYLTNGYPDRKSLNSLAVKLVLANQQSFYAIFTGGSSQVFTAAGSGGGGAIFINELVGLYARGVQ